MYLCYILTDCDMMIYESREYRLRNPDDAERFDRSHAIGKPLEIEIEKNVV